MCDNEKIIIPTSRLMIRQVSTKDEKYIFHAASCPQINLMHSNEFNDIVKVRNYIEVLTQEYMKGKYRSLAVAEKMSDRLIGMITLDVDSFFPRAEISYWIDKSYRNKGYATEAVKAVIEYGFSILGLNRIQAMHFTNNPASGCVLEKAGMLFEGTLRQYVGMQGVFFDCRLYSILKSDFTQAFSE